MDLFGIHYPGQDNFNLAPTETVHVLRIADDGTPQITPMRWWLTPFWAKELTTKYSMFNAKSETAAKSPAFKTPYQRRRCVVPITGFYEWCRQKNQKLPYFITAQDSDGLLLAGLWDSWHNKEADEEILSFTILTTAAHGEMSAIHHRQPIFLTQAESRFWLDMDMPTSELEYLFGPRLPVALDASPISTHVNNARHKDARCTHPTGESLLMPIG